MKFINQNNAIKEYDFNSWEVIGKGNERTCYLNPKNRNICLKVSYHPNTKQSKRELVYFNLLLKREIPFIHIPKVHSIIKEEAYIGLEQEVIRNHDGSLSLDIRKHAKKYCSTKHDQEKLVNCLNELYFYLLKYNIIPCDLMLSNILIKVDNTNNWKAFLIDGFGTTEIIPFTNYISFLGQLKIKRKWAKFYKYQYLTFMHSINND